LASASAACPLKSLARTPALVGFGYDRADTEPTYRVRLSPTSRRNGSSSRTPRKHGTTFNTVAAVYDTARHRWLSRAYASDMGRYGTRADMIVHEEQPFNAERGIAALAETLTATDACTYGRTVTCGRGSGCMAPEGARCGRA
jgi:hypothetical protein